MAGEALKTVSLSSYLYLSSPALTSGEQLGCTDFKDEWTCNEANGLDKMQPKWEHHWYVSLRTSAIYLLRPVRWRYRDTFYTVADFQEMAKLGLNSVRIPIGCELLSIPLLSLLCRQ